MAYEPKPGQLSLFKNDRKNKDSHPDYAGDGVDLEGNPVWINAWLRETKGGKKYFSISLKLKEAKADDSFRGSGSSGVAGGGARSLADDADLEIPF